MKTVSYYSPQQLAQLTANRKKEFKSLLIRLKKMKPGKLDELVHSLHEQAFSTFNCLDCANCCASISPIIIDSDIRRIARKQRLKPARFIEQYLLLDEDDDYVFRESPCPFLFTDNKCGIYEDHPRACREYPHTDRKRFRQILNLSLKNCEICPVVYAIFSYLSEQNK